MKDSFLQYIEVEIVRLSQIPSLPNPLSLYDRARATPEAAVVDPSHGRVVVSELGSNFGFRNEGGEFKLFGDMGSGVAVENGVVILEVAAMAVMG